MKTSRAAPSATISQSKSRTRLILAGEGAELAHETPVYCLSTLDSSVSTPEQMGRPAHLLSMQSTGRRAFKLAATLEHLAGRSRPLLLQPVPSRLGQCNQGKKTRLFAWRLIDIEPASSLTSHLSGTTARHRYQRFPSPAAPCSIAGLRSYLRNWAVDDRILEVVAYGSFMCQCSCSVGGIHMYKID